MKYLGFEPSCKKPYFFVSYNSEDHYRIAPIVTALAKLGISLWYDYGIPYDEKWEAIIAERIYYSESVLLFYTKSILEKDHSYVVREYKLARTYKKKIYVVLLDPINVASAPFTKASWLVELNEHQSITGSSQNAEIICREIMRATGLKANSGLSCSGQKTKDIRKCNVSAPTNVVIKCEAGEVTAPAVGTVIPRDQIPDAVFSSGVLGDGVGINPTEGVIFAPYDGIISAVADSKHAIGITGPGDMEILIHVGIDTVAMNGNGFAPTVDEGDIVKKGQVIMTFDRAKIAKANHPDCVVVLLTNSEDYNDVTCSYGHPFSRFGKYKPHRRD